MKNDTFRRLRFSMFALFVAFAAACSGTQPPQAAVTAKQVPAAKPVEAEAQPEPAKPAVSEPVLRPAPRRQASAPARPQRPAPPATVAPAEATANSRPAVATVESFIPAPPPPPAPYVEREPAPAPKPSRITIPAGTKLFVRMIDTVDSETDRVGQKYQASLDAPVELGDEIALSTDTDVFLKLIEVKSAGRVTGRSEIRVQLDRIVVDGKSYAVDSTIHQAQGESRGKSTAKAAGIGAAIGAAVGAISGGAKGAVIGGSVGAGSGVGVQAVTKGPQVRIDSESLLEFRLEQAVEIEKIVKKM